MSVEEKLRVLGLELPPVSAPLANYVPVRIAGDLLFVSGQGPRRPDGAFEEGIVGDTVSADEARDHARLAGLHILAAVKDAVGDFDRVLAVVKLFGMVNATTGFRDHPRVINGCSDLLVNVLGERGRHARSAIGQGSLPNNMTVEIEAIFQVARKEG